MTDSLDELIAEARSLSTYEGSTLERAADALERLRAERDEALAVIEQARDEALAVIEQVQLLADALVQARDERDAAWAGSNARLDAALAWEARAEAAEATLARVREWAEGIALQPDPPADDEMAGQVNAAGDVLAILDEGRE